MAVDDFGRVIALGGVRYLNPADQVLEEMLTGWRRQQLSRDLSLDTINSREKNPPATPQLSATKMPGKIKAKPKFSTWMTPK